MSENVHELCWGETKKGRGGERERAEGVKQGESAEEGEGWRECRSRCKLKEKKKRKKKKKKLERRNPDFPVHPSRLGRVKEKGKGQEKRKKKKKEKKRKRRKS